MPRKRKIEETTPGVDKPIIELAKMAKAAARQEYEGYFTAGAALLGCRARRDRADYS